MLSITRKFKNAALLAACSTVLLAAPPNGWFMAGNKPAEYDCNVDPENSYLGQPATYVKSKSGLQTTGFGTLMQSFSAAAYAGKRVRFSAAVKSEKVETHGNDAWAGLWMRIDGEHDSEGVPRMLGFDNMQSRAIRGTNGWQSHSVVLDVPTEASNVALGILLSGSGAVWMSAVKVEVVGPEVAVTGKSPTKPSHDGPTNLGFDK